ncbi:MAG: hypothetical protein PHS41_11410, partial [Victivallaceae bacterium]|nr:hypothetical protein [Victivallaceae bacterium]
VIDPVTGNPVRFGSVGTKLTLTRLGVILTGTTAAGQSIYFPSVVRNRSYNASGAPWEKYRYFLYYSTDHEYGTSASGISMAGANAMTGPWAKIGNGKIVTLADLGYSSNSVSNSECETPSVWWCSKKEKYYMAWHTGNIQDAAPCNYAQTSFIAESPDGVAWTAVKRMFDIPMREIAGNGHNGYVQVYRHDNGYYATLLIGGGNGYMTDACSPDGLHWMVNPMQDNAVHSAFKLNGTKAPGDCVLVEFNQSALVNLSGQWYKIGGGGLPASGSAAKVYDLYAMPVLADKRTPAGPGELLLEMDSAFDETKNIRNTSSFIDDDGSIYILYTTRVGTNGVSRIHAAKLELS